MVVDVKICGLLIIFLYIFFISSIILWDDNIFVFRMIFSVWIKFLSGLVFLVKFFGGLGWIVWDDGDFIKFWFDMWIIFFVVDFICVRSFEILDGELNFYVCCRIGL